ncbi:hypothetical protein L6452_16264 [Arctium lappa]|uniref:Uncharacterized protein n=1 Tax=Arctium lappa TaxID=4217 RepID=A0ACB9C057_ARCLA|nr:hypothetical protein L6452_16264 [Arctium lappa]
MQTLSDVAGFVSFVSTRGSSDPILAAKLCMQKQLPISKRKTYGTSEEFYIRLVQVRLGNTKAWNNMTRVVKVPGFKLDLRDEHYPMSLEQVMAPIMQHFREIETCIGCSATNLVLVCDYVQL